MPHLSSMSSNADCYECLAPYYESIYEGIDAEETVRQWWQLLSTSKLLQAAPAGLRLLDIGCGPGHHLKAWRDLGFTVTGVDSSRSLLKLAKKRLSNGPKPCELFCVNALSLSDLPERGQFDIAVSHFNFLNLFPPAQLETLFASVAGVVRTGGLWITDYAEPRRPPEAVNDEIIQANVRLIRTGRYKSKSNCYDQMWSGPGLSCRERFWFGHSRSLASAAKLTGWRLPLRVGWRPNQRDAPWISRRRVCASRVDVFQRKGAVRL